MINDSDDFAEFMKDRREVAEAYVTGDTAPLGTISASSDPVTFFGPTGGVVQGAEAVLSTNERGATQFRPGGTTSLEILHMSASEGIGYWVGLQHATVLIRDAPEPVPMTLRVTEIFRRENGNWKLVHRHADPVSTGQATTKS